MKQKIRLGDCYALTKHKLNQLTIRYFSPLAVLLIMCLYAAKQASAQQAEPAAAAVANIKPLQIGDTIPEHLWHLPLQVVNHPEGKDSVTLNDYRGKLIILDFWATWCSSCIKSMPKTNQLADKNANQMAVLAVTYEPLAKVSKFWYSNSVTEQIDFPTVVDGDKLKEAFPHKSVPHLVWISKQGRVTAFTSSAQLDKSKLALALAGDFSELTQKVNVDIHKPLFTTETLPMEKLQHYAVLFQGSIDGLGGSSVLRRTEGVVHGRMLSNKTLLTLFEICVRKMMPDYSRERLVYGQSGSDSILTDSTLYSIEVIVPVSAPESLYPEMLRTLNRYSPYTAEVVSKFNEEGQRQFLVIKEKNQ